MPSIGIFGANGRMGRALITVAKEQQLQLTAATVRSGSDLIGVDAGELAGVGKLVVGIGCKFIFISLISNIFLAKSYHEH